MPDLPETKIVAATPERVLQLVDHAASVADAKLAAIHKVAMLTRILSLNATITAARAGDAGLSFAAVANEVKALAVQVATISEQMETELKAAFTSLREVGENMAAQVRGERLVDLALNAIEIIDRNLYERTCDVRWWATDAGAVAAVAPDAASPVLVNATQRLGVILSAYTVYLDLWICDPSGRVIVHGRPDRYPKVVGHSVSGEKWFQQALSSGSGNDFSVSNVNRCTALGGLPVVTYAAAIRENGTATGQPLGVIGVHFDWEPQANTVVRGVRLTEEERSRTRVLLVDAHGGVLASSDDKGALTESIHLDTGGRESGTVTDAQGRLIAFHLTPGYETYRGLGWYGVLMQTS